MKTDSHDSGQKPKQKMTRKATPAPWVAGDPYLIDAVAGWAVPINAELSPCANIADAYGPTEGEARANAETMAAGPDLRDALRRCLDALRDDRMVELVFGVGHDVDLALAVTVATRAADMALSKAGGA